MSKHSSFLELLKAPLKIISNNGKLIAIATTVYLTLNSLLVILYMLSANPFIVDLLHKLRALASVRPGTPDFTKLLVVIRDSTGIFLGIEAASFVLFFFVGLFAHTTVIIIASFYYNGYDLSLKKLVLKLSKIWTRPFDTCLWVKFLSLGYTSFFLFLFLVSVLIFIAILFITFYIYLSVVWSLAIVVSVVENSYGYSALGKARELVKGKRVHGFLLNLLLDLVSLIIIIIATKLSPVMPIVVGVIYVLLTGIISMFKSMAYSGFYFLCKNDKTKSGGLAYSKIPTTPVVDEYLP